MNKDHYIMALASLGALVLATVLLVVAVALVCLLVIIFDNLTVVIRAWPHLSDL